MTPTELREARLTLGLSLNQAARLLDTHPRGIRQFEAPTDAATHRPLPARLERLMRAYLAGYRPDDWPTSDAG